MSLFVTTTDLLEEIVETTEEQEADLCSSGETVDECVTDHIAEYIDVPEVESKYIHQTVPVTVVTSGGVGGGAGAVGSRSHKSNSRGSSASSSVGMVAGTPVHATNGHPRGARANHHMEQEKRMRREIANSNERRRMQSINAGFQSLRTLLPHHEGEKLSKAAILQQTAEYIYQLEQQKTQLLSQNLHLKRLVGDTENTDIVPPKKRRCENGNPVSAVAIHSAVIESGDEGLGSMSPEPLSVITVSPEVPDPASVPIVRSISCNPKTNHSNSSTASNNTTASSASNCSVSDLTELKRQLLQERTIRQHLEKQVQNMKSQISSEPFQEVISYQPHEVIEHTNNVLSQELDESVNGIHLVSVVSVPTVGSTQTIETSNADSDTPPMSPQPGCEIIVPSVSTSPIDQKELLVNDLLQIKSRPTSPNGIMSFSGVQVFTASSLDEQNTKNGNFSLTPVTYAYTVPVAAPAVVTTTPSDVTRIQKVSLYGVPSVPPSPTRSFSPEEQDTGSQQPQPQQPQPQPQPQQQRLPSVLEAAIKAEPKVEVERLPSPSNSIDDGTPQARLYLANTSRQNLETIVEAIRHLEGDHLFSDEPAQDVPLALTNKISAGHTEVSNFLQFQTTTLQQHPQQPSTATTTSSSSSSNTSSSVSQVATTMQNSTGSRTPQQRPGVIVVKHS